MCLSLFRLERAFHGRQENCAKSIPHQMGFLKNYHTGCDIRYQKISVKVEGYADFEKFNEYCERYWI